MGGCVVVSVAIHPFARMSHGLPVGTETSLEVSNPNCSWWVEAWGLNPFGSFRPRFVSRPLDSDSSGGASIGTCDGPLVTHFFDARRGDDEWVDFSEAKWLQNDIDKRLSNHGACGAEGGVGVRVCFAKATTGDRLDADGVKSFVGCLVGHESAACRKIVCA